MNTTAYVLFWYLLGLKLTWGHAHKTRSWYLLGVTFRKSEEHPGHFYMGVPPGMKWYQLAPEILDSASKVVLPDGGFPVCCVHLIKIRILSIETFYKRTHLGTQSSDHFLELGVRL